MASKRGQEPVTTAPHEVSHGREFRGKAEMSPNSGHSWYEDVAELPR